MTIDYTYCAMSNNCKHVECPRHLNGFNSLYISLGYFNCKEELNSSKLDNLINEEDD